MMLEKTFEHCGYRCEVRIMPVGHRCGYVFVEKGHPLHGVLDDELPVDFRPEVNGGITYAGHKNNDDRWAFGFDFDHYWDIPDDACNEYKMACNPGLTRENLEIINTRLDPDARVATLDMAVEDCERLAECLLEWSGKPYVYTIDDSWYYSDRMPDEIVCKGVRYVQAEKSCCVVGDGDSYDEYEYYIEHHWWDLSCGHTVLTLSNEEVPRYCVECGKKVVPYEKSEREQDA